ncbi:MAG: hypothetical protein Q9202_004950 [Teloschistes flavicans]
MFPTARLLAAHQRQPLIKFLGKRSWPTPSPTSASSSNQAAAAAAEEEPPSPHPASPTHDLPESFASYRSNAQQHGPLARQSQSAPSSAFSSSPSSQQSSRPASQSPVPASRAYGRIGGHSGHSLGRVEPGEGMVMDKSELPKRFQGLAWTEEEIEGVELGGANLRVGWGGS